MAGDGEEVDYSASPAWVGVTSALLCLAGLAVDTYLTIQHYFSAAVPLSCPETGAINCAKVLSSQWSKLFGIPLTDVGVAYFVAMLALTGPWAWNRPSRPLRWVRLPGVVVSMVMVVYLVHAELADIRAICLFCTATHIIAFALFIVVLAGDAYER